MYKVGGKLHNLACHAIVLQVLKEIKKVISFKTYTFDY